MVDREQLERWAYDGAPTKIIRALARAWLHSDLLPQNAGQYRAGVIEPAIEDAIADAIARGLLMPNVQLEGLAESGRSPLLDSPARSVC